MSTALVQSRRVLLDSNLFVLLCAGEADPDRITSHKRLQSYDRTDYEILCGLIKCAAEVVIVPNTATETSNLARQAKPPYRDLMIISFKALVETFVEICVSSRDAVMRPEFSRLGLTDSALLQLLEKERDSVLLTADHNLYMAAAYSKFRAVNFNHIRDQRSDFR